MSEEETSALRRLLPPGNEHLFKSFDSLLADQGQKGPRLGKNKFSPTCFLFCLFSNTNFVVERGVARQNTQQIKNVTTVKLALKRPCEDLVAAYGRWSLARKEPMGASSEKNPPVKSFYIHVFNWIPPGEKPETQKLIARHQAGRVLIRIKCFNIRKLEGRQKGILSMCLCEYVIISICDNLLCIYSVMNN